MNLIHFYGIFILWSLFSSSTLHILKLLACKIYDVTTMGIKMLIWILVCKLLRFSHFLFHHPYNDDGVWNAEIKWNVCELIPFCYHFISIAVVYMCNVSICKEMLPLSFFFLLQVPILCSFYFYLIFLYDLVLFVLCWMGITVKV